MRLHSLFVFGILCSAVWWIKIGWAKTGSVFSWTIDVTRFRGITLTRLLFIKTEFYRTNMFWIIGCKLYFMVTRQLVDWTNEATLKLNIKWTFSCHFMHLYISLSILYATYLRHQSVGLGQNRQHLFNKWVSHQTWK